MSASGIPEAFTRAGLASAGYGGWRTWDELRATAYQGVPQQPGCYVVLRADATAPPRFRESSPAGHFKGKDPTVSLTRLSEEWVESAPVTYVGKADKLRTRLRAYGRFGAGEPVAHWGGRLIWQLEHSNELLVAWWVLTEPGTARDLERALLARFVALHGRRPFANLTG